jgi:hypothetical protein
MDRRKNILDQHNDQSQKKFSYEIVLIRFGCPFTLVSDQGTHFINEAILILTIHFLVKHTSSTTYYQIPTGK